MEDKNVEVSVNAMLQAALADHVPAQVATETNFALPTPKETTFFDLSVANDLRRQ